MTTLRAPRKTKPFPTPSSSFSFAAAARARTGPPSGAAFARFFVPIFFRAKSRATSGGATCGTTSSTAPHLLARELARLGLRDLLDVRTGDEDVLLGRDEEQRLDVGPLRELAEQRVELLHHGARVLVHLLARAVERERGEPVRLHGEPERLDA